MRFSFLHLCFVLTIVFFQVQGDPQILRYYEELNCSKLGNGGYDCSYLDKMKKEKCYFKQKEYSIGSKLDENETSEDDCVRDCECRQRYLSEGAEWECVNVECPQELGHSPNCTVMNKHGTCCGDLLCDEAQPTNLTTCEYKGVSYDQGQKFYPDEEECTVCICDAGFSGKIAEPWCKEFSCNSELYYLEKIRNKCLPLYVNDKSCCPIYDFRCPDKEDTVIKPKNVPESSIEAKCIFGDLKLSVGEKLSPKKLASSCTECVCEVPPTVTCIMKNCE